MRWNDGRNRAGILLVLCRLSFLMLLTLKIIEEATLENMSDKVLGTHFFNIVLQAFEHTICAFNQRSNSRGVKLNGVSMTEKMTKG